MSTRHIILQATAALLLIIGAQNSASAQEYIAPPVTISTEIVKMSGKPYYSHTVLEKQTLYSISKAYNVSIEEINQANPIIAQEGLKNGSVILIPKKDEPQLIIEQETDGDYIKHKVKWYEKLSDIAKEYNCPEDIIIKFNNLKSDKLKSRQILRIPTEWKETIDNAIAKISSPDSTIVDSLSKTGEAIIGAIEDGINTLKGLTEDFFGQDKVEITYLLPLSQNDSPNKGNMDFYSGALLAARDAGNEGIDVNCNVIDIATEAWPTKQNLKKTDLIIGPISHKDVDSSFVHNQDSLMIISPIDPRVEDLVYQHKNLIQVPCRQDKQIEDLINWIKEDRQPEDSVVVIFESNSKDMLPDSQVNKLLEASGMSYQTFNYGILEGRNITTTLESMINIEGENRFLLISDSEAIMNDMVRNLNLLLHDKYNVIMYGPSKIRSFETIEIENLHNTKFHCSLSYYIDYERPSVQKFLKEYRALYNAEPSPFAYQGYDITKFFIEAINTYGKHYPKKLESLSLNMLQSTMTFKQISPEGGFINEGIRRIIYKPDYEIELVK